MVNDPASGLVILAGAGPGDPHLITLAAADWLAQADTVVYDRLAAPSLLALAPPDAERVYVGKGRDGNALSQDEINRLLVERARQGQLVVRLKGGDPFVFGRGGEEAGALAAAGVPYRVVPGVTAAAGACAYAGIPLTDRRLASSVALVTGQEDPTREGSRLNWQALAGIDTLAFYMGVQALPEIAEKLIAAGRRAETPAAIIERGTTSRQRVVTGTLATLAVEAARHDIRPPAMIVIGEVVSLRDRLAWLPQLPLTGRTVLVTRTRQQASTLSQELAWLGAEVIEAPTVDLAGPEDPDAVDAVFARLAEYDIVAFTSPNGVEAFCGWAERLELDARALAGARLAAVGAATAAALERRFLRADLVPEVFTTEALAALLTTWGDLRGRRVLLARADIARPHLADALREAGAVVEDLAIYRTVRPESLPPAAVEALREERVDWITFTSGSTVDNFLALAGPLLAAPHGRASLLAKVRLASIGPVTSEALRRHGLCPAIEAKRHDIPGLVEAILAATGGPGGDAT